MDKTPKACFRIICTIYPADSSSDRCLLSYFLFSGDCEGTVGHPYSICSNSQTVPAVTQQAQYYGYIWTSNTMRQQGGRSSQGFGVQWPSRAILDFEPLFCTDDVTTPVPGVAVEWLCSSFAIERRREAVHNTTVPVFTSKIDWRLWTCWDLHAAIQPLDKQELNPILSTQLTDSPR